eukprot:12008473-Prorocentrum_lima.AAC.1
MTRLHANAAGHVSRASWAIHVGMKLSASTRPTGSPREMGSSHGIVSLAKHQLSPSSTCMDKCVVW